MARQITVTVDVPDPPVDLERFGLTPAGGCVVNLTDILLISPYRIVFKNGAVAELREGGSADFSELLGGCLGHVG